MNQARQGYIDDITGEPIAPRPEYQIYDLPDIVALTVVVTYPSDLANMQRIIDTAIKEEAVYCYNTDTVDGRQVFGVEKRRGGYYAYHYHLGFRPMRYRDCRCELQLKTVLHDAWTAKTHDTTYKPYGFLDDRLRRQMEVLGDTLALIDEQSELLKMLIHEHWFVEKKRKDAARQQILLATPRTTASSGPVLQRIETVRGAMLAAAPNLLGKTLDDPQIESLIEDTLACVEPDINPLNACLLLALLGSLTNVEDVQNFALSKIDEWIINTNNNPGKLQAELFKGFVQQCFGRDLGTINTIEDGLAKYLAADIPQDEESHIYNLVRAYNMLVYSYADIADTTAGRQLSAGSKARESLARLKDTVRKWKKNEPNIKPEYLLFVLDTEGYMKIMCGESPEEIMCGMRMCEEAYERMPEERRETQKLFVELHRNMGLRRLIQRRGIGERP